MSEEPLTLSFNYVSSNTLLLIKIIIILLLLLILYLSRHKIKKLITSVQAGYKPHYTPVLLIILGIILWTFSRVLSVIFVLGALALLLLLRLKKSS